VAVGATSNVEEQVASDGGAWSDAALTRALNGPDRGPVEDSAQLIITTATTGAKPVLASTVRGQHYWMKWPGNPHGNLSLVHELVVGRLGARIAAPVRPTALIRVDEALVEGQYVDGSRLPAGVYLGSELLRDVEEGTNIARVARDGNSTRFAFYLALWDLCLGSDLQLLYHLAEHDQVWSIDHGLWFDSLEGDWTSNHLAQRSGEPWPWPPDISARALDETARRNAADAVEGLSCADLADVMSQVPLQWSVADDVLRTLAKFIYERRSLVAQRLRDAVGDRQ
jgi:hypothetical protein